MMAQDSQDRIFEVLAEIESRLEKRLDAMEAQTKEGNDRLGKRLDSIETNASQLREDVGWIQGKLESKQESKDKMLNVSILGASTVAIKLYL